MMWWKVHEKSAKQPSAIAIIFICALFGNTLFLSIVLWMAGVYREQFRWTAVLLAVSSLAYTFSAIVNHTRALRNAINFPDADLGQALKEQA